MKNIPSDLIKGSYLLKVKWRKSTHSHTQYYPYISPISIHEWMLQKKPLKYPWTIKNDTQWIWTKLNWLTINIFYLICFYSQHFVFNWVIQTFNWRMSLWINDGKFMVPVPSVLRRIPYPRFQKFFFQWKRLSYNYLGVH